MSGPPRIGIHGASGRMGRELLQLAIGDARFAGVAEIDLRGPEVPPRVDVVVDFSTPEGCVAITRHCRREGLALVSGTTGLDAAGERALDAAGADIAVLHAANFSLGVAVLTQLLARAAALLPDWELEIIEAHHAGKRDAPSGTALALGRAAAAARGLELDAVRHPARSGHEAPRDPREIGFASVRASDIVGEHTALLAGQGERIELSHRAADRAIFARGALAAVSWLAAMAPGRYGLDDFLDSLDARQ